MALYTRVHTCPILSADSSFAPSFDRGFFVMARSDVTPSLLAEGLIITLIEEVEKRPALYKKHLKEYSDANMKKKLWEEVCEAIISNWNRLSVEDKTKQGMYRYMCIFIYLRSTLFIALLHFVILTWN
jgi:hypothetical protein